MFNFLLSIAIVLPRIIALPEAAPHDFFVSVIEVYHEEGQQEAMFRFRIFSDDLQTGLQSEFGMINPPDLNSICDNPDIGLVEFLNNHIDIRINDRESASTRTTCSVETDVHEIIWYLPTAPVIETLEIKADYLMDVYPGQIQMVHVTESGHRRTLQLTRRSPKAVIDFRN